MEQYQDCNHTNCAHASANQSVCQTLLEMDWERGIWNAAFNGEKDRVQYLIDKAKNAKEIVNAPDNSGYTALHYAASKGHIDVGRLLIANGANIDAQTRTGDATPLHKAAASGKLAMVNFLIRSGAKLDSQDIDGQTVLHKAIQHKHFDLVDVLLANCPQLAQIEDGKGCVPNVPAHK